jgi:hypothetical protein
MLPLVLVALVAAVYPRVYVISQNCVGTGWFLVEPTAYPDIIYYNVLGSFPNFTQARTWCAENLHPQARLAIIREQTVADYIGKLNSISWLGLTKDPNVTAPLDGWYWYPDNISETVRPVEWSPFGYSSLTPNVPQPDNFNNSEYCAFIQGDGGFADGPCSAKMTPICEIHGTITLLNDCLISFDL